jgi:hypothetical protein
MNRLSIKQLLILVFIFFLGFAVCNAQATGKGRHRNPEKSLFGGKSRKVKETKVKVKGKEPKAAVKAKEKQAKKEAKLEKDFNNYVVDSRKRAFKIQSPEVKARIIQNKKDIKAREKAKKKRTSTVTRKAGKKYK